MQLTDLMILISGKQEIKSTDMADIKDVISKYPYFETLYNLYLQGLKKINSSDFDKALERYSVFINDRKKIYNTLFFNPSLKKVLNAEVENIKPQEKIIEHKTNVEVVKEEKKKSSGKDDVEFDPELYERQKEHHVKVVEDFVVPKSVIFGDLSKLLKDNDLNEHNFFGEMAIKSEKIEKEVVEEKIEETKQADVKIDKVEEENEKIKQSEIKQDEVEEKTHEIKQAEVKQDELEEKIDEITNEKSDVVDDVFAKIKKLKEERLKASQLYEEKIEEIKNRKSELNKANDDFVEENNSEIKKEEEPEFIEEVNTVVKEEEPEFIEEVNTVVKEEENKIVEEKTAADKILEKLKFTKSTADTEKKVENSISETEKSAADKILEKLQGSKNIEKTLDFDLESEMLEENKDKEEIIDLDEEQTVAIDLTDVEVKDQKEPEKITDKKEEITEFEVEILEKEEQIIEEQVLEKEEVVPEEVTIEEQIEQEDKKEEPKKSAADLILEKLAKRKEVQPEPNKLIDKFLTEQPTMDRKKEPEKDVDLSANSIKEPEVATERLAEIYTLQGLYDKAIETYNKLILKFPEKSTLFADKIKELESKK
ncbi:MAG: hypothetical protein JXL97_10460 [Bacteroidales bacterium]|nr:hypothetical protein [Bacteroidales bacterium]